MDLCHLCGTRPADEASRVTDDKTQTKRMRRCPECKKHSGAITKAVERALRNSLLVAAGALLVVLVFAYAVWGWGEYMAGIAMGVGILWVIGLVVTMITSERRAEKQIPYKFKNQFLVQRELDEALTASDLMRAVAPEIAYSTVAVALARWESSKLGTLIGKAVFGQLLAPADFRAGLIGVADRQLFVVDFGKIAISACLILETVPQARIFPENHGKRRCFWGKTGLVGQSLSRAAGSAPSRRARRWPAVFPRPGSGSGGPVPC